MVGIWNIFQTIGILVLLLDMGFRPSFARNISYIFSGVRSLQVNGVASVSDTDDIDYSLLKGTLSAMKMFYRIMAVVVFLLLATIGSIYFYHILQKYNGNHIDATIAWILLVSISCYNLYTLYYDALLLGKGYVRRSQQIIIIGKVIYLLVAVVLLYCGCGLSAIVGAQLISVVISRVLSYRVFFTPAIKNHLAETDVYPKKEIFRVITPNAIKVGLTGLGGFMVNKSAMLIGSAFLSLEQLAGYGITIQVMDVLARCACVTYQSYTPKLAQCRAKNDMLSLRKYYIYSIVSLLMVYLVGGTSWVLCGNWLLQLIHSKTLFLPVGMLCTMLVINTLENNHYVSAGFIMADNKVPFFVPSLVSGGVTVILLWLFLSHLEMGVWGLILAPGIVQLMYQNWKWPSVIIKELHEARVGRTSHS